MKKLFLVTLSIAIVLASCCVAKSTLTKRYKSIKLIENNDTIGKYVKVSAYLIEKEKVDEQKPKTIFDLSPQAQSSIIKEISKKETGTSKFIAVLTDSLSFKPIKKTDDIINDYQIERRIVISVINKSHIPADRISRIKITLAFDKKNLKILSCDKLITAYQTLDIGKTNYTSTKNAEIVGNASIGAGTKSINVLSNQDTIGASAETNAGFSGKLSSTRSYSEEVLLKQRIISLNTELDKNKLSFYQEGISGIDLTGNILADVKLEFIDLNVDKVYSFTNLKTGDKFNEPSLIKVNDKTIIYPNLSKDKNVGVKVSVSYEADFRKVIKNHETISESDDSVKLYYGAQSNKDSLVIPRTILMPALYKISLKGDSEHLPIQINFPNGSNELLFYSYNEAKDFLLWMISKFDKNKKEIPIGDSKFWGIEFNMQNFSITMPSSYKPNQGIEIQKQ